MKRPVKTGLPGISAMSNPPMTRLIVLSPELEWNTKACSAGQIWEYGISRNNPVRRNKRDREVILDRDRLCLQQVRLSN